MAINRFFKPAEYVPQVTEVDYPFQDLAWAAAKSEEMKMQKYAALNGDSKGTAPAEGTPNYLVRGQGYMPNPQYQQGAALKSQLDSKLAEAAAKIAYGNITDPEYNAVFNQLKQIKANLEGPGGILGMDAANAAAYQEGEKKLKDVKGLDLDPAMSAEWEKQKYELVTGQRQSLDPNFSIGKEININAEMDKMYEHAKTAGLERSRYDATGMKHTTGFNNGFTQKEAAAIFDTQFGASDAHAKLLRDRDFWVGIGKYTPEEAQALYEQEVSDMRASAINKYGKRNVIDKVDADIGYMGWLEEKAQIKQSLERKQTPAVANPLDKYNQPVNLNFTKYTNDNHRVWAQKQVTSTAGGTDEMIILNQRKGTTNTTPLDRIPTSILSKSGLLDYMTVSGVLNTNPYGTGAGSRIGEIDLTKLEESDITKIMTKIEEETKNNQGVKTKKTTTTTNNQVIEPMDLSKVFFKDGKPIRTIQVIIPPDNIAKGHYEFGNFLTQAELVTGNSNYQPVFVPPQSDKWAEEGGGRTFRSVNELMADNEAHNEIPNVIYRKEFLRNAHGDVGPAVVKEVWNPEEKRYEIAYDEESNPITIDTKEKFDELVASEIHKMVPRKKQE